MNFTQGDAQIHINGIRCMDRSEWNFGFSQKDGFFFNCYNFRTKNFNIAIFNTMFLKLIFSVVNSCFFKFNR